MKLVWGFAVLCVCFYRADASAEPTIIPDPPMVYNETSAVLRCNLTTTLPIKGSQWLYNGKVIDSSISTSASPFTTHSLEKITTQIGGKYECVFLVDPPVQHAIEVKTPPHVVAYKHSENADENEKIVLTCVSHSYPLPNDWSWFKIGEDGSQSAIANGTIEKYEIKSTPNKTSLIISDLNIEQDKGEYMCSGTSELGTASDRIQLRVRSRLAAVWPFLGIVAEVIILVTIIFIYEKRRKPDEITDDDDSGAAPLKSNSDTNHKDKNVRQRNSN